MKTNEKIEARLAKMKTAIPKLKKENQEIAQLLCGYFGAEYYSSKDAKLFRLLTEGKTQLAEVFSGNRSELIPFLFGPDKKNHQLFEKLWNRLPIYSYQGGYLRRSFRTQEETLLYLSKGMALIGWFLQAMEFGCTMQTYWSVNLKN